MWSCGITLFLCSWSAVCINIPARRDSYWKKLQRKLWLTWICLAGPEYLLAIALGQWCAAKDSVRDFREAKRRLRRPHWREWTWKHAFYAEMGGFVAVTQDDMRFPLRGKSLLHLITNDLIAEEDIEKKILFEPRIINDRNKMDTLLRLITLGQATWFCINVLARFVQHLPVTTVELTVLAFFFPTACTYGLWWHKPADVDTIELIDVQARSDELPPDQSEWHRTPLDFVDREEWHGSKTYRNWLSILDRINPLAASRRRPKSKPISRRSDNELLPQPVKYQLIFELLPTLPFLSINFIAWNDHFPTTTERTLWRIAAVTMMVMLLAGPIIEETCLSLCSLEKEAEKMVKRRKELADHEAKQAQPAVAGDIENAVPKKVRDGRLHRLRMDCKRLLMRLRNNTPDGDPHLDVPLKIYGPATPMAAIYCLCRAYIYIEDAIQYRAMPVGAFDTVNWSGFLPHIG